MQNASWNILENTCKCHEYCYSALADIVDNPQQAFATKCRMQHLASHLATRSSGRTLVLSDDGRGFESRHHISEAYDIGKSIGEGKGDKYNYGMGEKAGGLKLADTIMKMAEVKGDSGAVRLIVMLSRTMQQIENGTDDFLSSKVMRPVTEWRLSSSEPNKWELQPSDAENLKVVLQYSPFESVEEIMQTFDALRGDRDEYRTHTILHSLSSKLEFSEATADLLFKDYEEDGWRAKKSARALLSLLFPNIASDGAKFVPGFKNSPFQLELFGKTVEALDLTTSSSRWKYEVVDLLPGGTIDLNGKAIRNDTVCGLRVGFVFDALALLADNKRIRGAKVFTEKEENIYQGTMFLSRGRVMQMPEPSLRGRSGSLVNGRSGKGGFRGGFRSGVGAFSVVSTPPGMKGNLSKTSLVFDSTVQAEHDKVKSLLERIWKNLHEQIQQQHGRSNEASEPDAPSRHQSSSRIPRDVSQPTCYVPSDRCKEAGAARRPKPKRRKLSVARQESSDSDDDRCGSGIPDWSNERSTVWARLHGHPWWPGKICSRGPDGTSNAKPGHVWINFYGDNTFGEVTCTGPRSCIKQWTKENMDAMQQQKLKSTAIEGGLRSAIATAREEQPQFETEIEQHNEVLGSELATVPHTAHVDEVQLVTRIAAALLKKRSLCQGSGSGGVPTSTLPQSNLRPTSDGIDVPTSAEKKALLKEYIECQECTDDEKGICLSLLETLPHVAAVTPVAASAMRGGKASRKTAAKKVGKRARSPMEADTEPAVSEEEDEVEEEQGELEAMNRSRDAPDEQAEMMIHDEGPDADEEECQQQEGEEVNQDDDEKVERSARARRRPLDHPYQVRDRVQVLWNSDRYIATITGFQLGEQQLPNVTYEMDGTHENSVTLDRIRPCRAVAAEVARPGIPVPHKMRESDLERERESDLEYEATAQHSSLQETGEESDALRAEFVAHGFEKELEKTPNLLVDLDEYGVDTAEDLATLSVQELKECGMRPFQAQKFHAALHCLQQVTRPVV